MRSIKNVNDKSIIKWTLSKGGISMQKNEPIYYDGRDVDKVARELKEKESDINSIVVKPEVDAAQLQ